MTSAIARTHATLDAIVTLTERDGFAPTLEALADWLQLSSTSSARYRLDTCIDAGLVVRDSRARSMRLTRAGVAFLQR